MFEKFSVLFMLWALLSPMPMLGFSHFENRNLHFLLIVAVAMSGGFGRSKMHLLLIRFSCLLLYRVKNVAYKGNACKLLYMKAYG